MDAGRRDTLVGLTGAAEAALDDEGLCWRLLDGPLGDIKVSTLLSKAAGNCDTTYEFRDAEFPGRTSAPLREVLPYAWAYGEPVYVKVPVYYQLYNPITGDYEDTDDICGYEESEEVDYYEGSRWGAEYRGEIIRACALAVGLHLLRRGATPPDLGTVRWYERAGRAADWLRERFGGEAA